MSGNKFFTNGAEVFVLKTPAQSLNESEQKAKNIKRLTGKLKILANTAKSPAIWSMMPWVRRPTAQRIL